MAISDPKTDLVRYLRHVRDGFITKVDGLSVYDARRPMTPTATNLLGLVKHVAGVEAGYFGVTFGRTFPEHLAFEEDEAEIDDDMWVRPDESLEDIRWTVPADQCPCRRHDRSPAARCHRTRPVVAGREKRSHPASCPRPRHRRDEPPCRPG